MNSNTGTNYGRHQNCMTEMPGTQYTLFVMGSSGISRPLCHGGGMFNNVDADHFNKFLFSPGFTKKSPLNWVCHSPPQYRPAKVL